MIDEGQFADFGSVAESERMERERDGRRAGARPSRPIVPTPVIFSAAELMAQEFAPIRYVVEGYIAEGCTLLAGRPKIGKSWLCFDIAIAIADAETCLGGIRCAEGSVLYLALEDNRRRLKRRLQKLLLAGHAVPERLHLATEWPRVGEGGLDLIRDWIATTPDAKAVFVDILQMLRSSRGNRDSLYEADYAAVKGLQALAGETGVAIVIVHHTRKGGAEGSDPFEKISGTLGLSGAADAVLILDRDATGATLYARGRDIEEVESAVVFDKTVCKWRVQGDVAEVRRSDDQRRILEVLTDAVEAMNPREISVASGVNRNHVDQILLRLGKSGEVRKVGRGKYIHPDRHDLASPHPG